MNKSPGKSSMNKIINYYEQEVALGRAACPKNKLELKAFFRPAVAHCTTFYAVQSGSNFCICGEKEPMVQLFCFLMFLPFDYNKE